MTTANVFFSLLALATNVALVAVILLAVVRAPALRRIAPAALPFAAAVATVATLGSLYYSEVAGLRPCPLCWYQRGAMYPLALLLIVAVVTRRGRLWRVGLPLALVGLAISSYHYLIQHQPALSLQAVCSVDAPCTAAEIWQFGFISLAYMAGSAFALIAVLLWVGTRRVAASGGADAAGTRDAGMLVTATLAVAAVTAALFGAPAPPSAPAPPVAGGEGGTMAAPEVAGEPLPPLEDPGDDPAVGMQLPEVVGTDYDGRPAAIDPGDGRAKVVMVLAHWCPHCQAEVPVVQGWLNDNGVPEDVDLYSVSTSVDESAPNYPPQDWLEREGWTPAVIADDDAGTARNILGVSGYPFFIFVAPDGSVVGRQSGQLPIEQFEEAVVALPESGT